MKPGPLATPRRSKPTRMPSRRLPDAFHRHRRPGRGLAGARGQQRFGGDRRAEYRGCHWLRQCWDALVRPGGRQRGGMAAWTQSTATAGTTNDDTLAGDEHQFEISQAAADAVFSQQSEAASAADDAASAEADLASAVRRGFDCLPGRQRYLQPGDSGICRPHRRRPTSRSAAADCRAIAPRRSLTATSAPTRLTTWSTAWPRYHSRSRAIRRLAC